MVIENITSSGILGTLSNLPGVGTLVNVLSGIGLVIIIYFIFLIIRTITQIRHNQNIKKLAENVEEINKKMNILIGKDKKKK